MVKHRGVCALQILAIVIAAALPVFSEENETVADSQSYFGRVGHFTLSIVHHKSNRTIIRMVPVVSPVLIQRVDYGTAKQKADDPNNQQPRFVIQSEMVIIAKTLVQVGQTFHVTINRSSSPDIVKAVEIIYGIPGSPGEGGLIKMVLNPAT